MIQIDPNHAGLCAAISDELFRVRRDAASVSVEAFARVYLDQYFELPPSSMHTEIFCMLQAASESRGQRIAVAAPRGHAKSTIVSLAYVLYAALCRHEKYVMLVSATKEQAGQLLKHIKDELETNQKLRCDFPEACPGTGPGGKPTPWRGTKISLQNGALLQAKGIGQKVRGFRHQQYRPSMIIVDDLETLDQVRSEEQRLTTREWFDKELLKVGDSRTNVIVVGTILHYDSLLAGLLKTTQARWIKSKYKALITEPERTDLWERWSAIYSGLEEWGGASGTKTAKAFYEDHRREMDEGAEVLWPEQDPLEALMEMRLTEGRASFDSEKQNEPLDSEHCLFNAESFVYWDDEHGNEENLLKTLGSKAKFYGAWDPSLGTNPQRGDYSAVVITAYVERTKTSYVLAADLARRTPAQAIGRIIEYARMYRFSHFAVEENGFQIELKKNLQKAASDAKVRLPLTGVTNTGNKQGRIELMEPRVTQGKVRFCRNHKMLLEQLRQFPLAAHDDGPDALQMAIAVAGRVKPEIIVMRSGPYS